ncbi:apolipoprotein N-acyltransferase [Desertihabitans brevis]|uniref:Apolipoprotein N-acyltransferase n=1 Tax=Desertihabitans brevis TaxID=2268447 RepID=A0A367YZK7_9ACTN|nr:apolipoprotein N-acyltransferase [Desertihabitans brevis]
MPAALGAGALAAAGFAPLGWWPLTLVGVALLTVVVQTAPRRRFWLGYLFGVVFLGLSVGWVSVIAVPVAVALVAFESAFYGLLAVLVHRLRSVPGWPAVAAAAWVVVEWVYSSVPFDGFGWSRLGYTMVDAPLAGLYPLVGVAGVSFLTALGGQALAWLVLRLRRPSGRRGRGRWRPVAVVLAAALVLGLAGQLLRGWVPAAPAGGRQVTVGLVQGNVDGVGVAALGRARTVTNNHLSETITLMARARTGTIAMPDMVLWPENSTDIDPLVDPTTRRTVELSVQIADRPVQVGAVLQGPGPDERQTSALWYDPEQGVLDRMEKRDLVPFGEYIPFRDVLLPLVPMLQMVGAQSVAGTSDGLMTVPVAGEPVGVGTLICFEVAYDGTVAETVGSGAQLLVVQSNQATYGGTVEVPQQFAMTRVRAMESRREIAVATTSSASGFIGADGSVVWQTAEFTADSHSWTMPLRTTTTPAMQLGPTIGVASTVLLLGGIAVALWRRRAARGEPAQR